LHCGPDLQFSAVLNVAEAHARKRLQKSSVNAYRMGLEDRQKKVELKLRKLVLSAADSGVRKYEPLGTYERRQDYNSDRSREAYITSIFFEVPRLPRDLPTTVKQTAPPDFCETN